MSQKGAVDRRRKFVVEYLKDFNAKHAAIRAGYPAQSAATVGGRLLNMVDVQVAIDKALNGIIKESTRTVKDCLKDLADLRAACSGAVEFNPGIVQKCLEMEMRYHDAFPRTNKLEVSGPDGGPIETESNFVVNFVTASKPGADDDSRNSNT